MKKFKNKHVVTFLLIGAVTSLTYCTKTDQILNPNDAVTPPTPVENTDTLYSVKVSSGPAFVSGLGNAWDGTLDPIWNSAPKIKVTCTVPNLGNNTFTGFIGNTCDVTMHSLYDANNIYILAEWDGVQKNVKSSPWYFNPVTKAWAQESGSATFDVNGIQTRLPFSQDQFVILFNIANSCYDFYSQSCYAACHVKTPSMVVDASGNVISIPNYGGTMRTKEATEKLDCWRARMVQSVYANQAIDAYIDWGNGGSNANGINKDPQINSTDGGINNKQIIKVTGQNYKVNVPMWMNVNATYNNGDGAILASDTTSGIAAKVTAVDTNGVLTLNSGAPIDPTIGTDYLRVGEGLGSKCIPGTIVSLYTGSCADVSANAFYTGTGWRLMLKRALQTSDTYKQDINFSSLSDQLFGIGIMFNGADNQHAIHTGMILHFKK